MKHGTHKEVDMQWTKGHIYAVIICATVIIISLISTFGK